MENGSNRRFILLYFIIITKTRVRVCVFVAVCVWCGVYTYRIREVKSEASIILEDLKAE